MKTPPFLLSLILIALSGLARTVCGQSSPAHDTCHCGRNSPGHDPAIHAALKACESSLGGSPGHPVARGLVECMQARCFRRSSGSPHGPGNPLPQASGS